MAKRRLILISSAIVVAAGAVVAWLILFQAPALTRRALRPATAGSKPKRSTLPTKYAGRIKTILANEGDTVGAGQVVATIDTEPMEAQLRQAQAQIREAEDNRRTALAQVGVKKAELDYASKQSTRSKGLVGKGAVSQQEREVDLAQVDVARAALEGVKAQEVRAQSAIDAATAEGERLQAQIADNTLRAPLRARFRAAWPSPVKSSGPVARCWH